MTSPLSNGTSHSSSTSSSNSSKKRSRDSPPPPPTSQPTPTPPSPLPPSSTSSSSSSYTPRDDAGLIVDEYRVWKKNSPYLYDVVLSAELEWPSLTCQWLPDRRSLDSADVVIQRLLMGTQTDGSEGNYVIIAEVKLPAEGVVVDAEEFSKQVGDHEKVGGLGAGHGMGEEEAGGGEGGGGGAGGREVGGWGVGGKSGKVEVVQRIPHPSEVNRARYLPHNPDIIATRGVEADLYIFDRTRYASKPMEGGGWTCDVRLRGHGGEGYGMGWSVVEEGRLASCAGDGSVCVWDVTGGRGERGEARVILPTLSWTSAHGTAAVNDVSLSYTHPHLLATCGDDSLIRTWDIRIPPPHLATHQLSHHTAAVNSVHFSPLSHYTLASASDDHSVCVWDIRQPASPLHVLRAHHDSVIQVQWCTFDVHVLASAGADRRVAVWDVSREEEEEEEEEGGGKEEGEGEGGGKLVFLHAGHTDKVGELSWNGVEEEPWMVASVADNNIVQVWQVADNIVGHDSDDDDEQDGVVEEQVKKSKTS